jgi:hypothetical protein
MKRTISTLLLVLLCLTPWIQQAYGAETCRDNDFCQEDDGLGGVEQEHTQTMVGHRPITWVFEGCNSPPQADTRTREEIIADLQREVDDWRENMIRQFGEKIEAHAEALKSLIEDQVK